MLSSFPTNPPSLNEETLVLPASLTSEQARPLAQCLAANVAPVLRLEAQDVTRVGGLCLQVLLAATRDFTATGRELIVTNPSAAWSEGLALFGASGLLAAECAA